MQPAIPNITAALTYADGGSQYSVNVTSGSNVMVSDAAVLTVVPAVNHLVISEVATCFYYTINCWFEIHNPTAAAINLSGYTVRAATADVIANALASTATFSLPSVSVPSEGYVIVSGNSRNAPQRGTQQVLLRSGNQVPYWGADGFIELVANSATIDFVRFGTSTQVPLTTSQWSGASVAALPSLATSYGMAIVRLYPYTTGTDNNTSADWTQVNWTTPAGRNDVDANAVDTDSDGIPDSAEAPGGTFAGLDLYAMGARIGTRDIFIEVDQMSSADPGVIVRAESLQLVVDAFSAKGIALHIDAGTAFSSAFSVANFNLGQGSNLVPYEPCVTLSQTTCTANISTRRSLYDWKDDSMDLRRRAIFHYALFGNSQLASGAAGSSGVAELPGNDFLVTMGNWGFVTTPTASLNQLINMHASTFMHEFGHNLGLRHGGFENTNYKPNYWSVMNYTYQLNGLDANPAAGTAYLRWKREIATTGNPARCSLTNSPCGDPSQFVMSYSDGSSADLNESSLIESANIGRGSSGGGYADWNLDLSSTSTVVIRDLNLDAVNSVLKDYNDWANLALPFARGSWVNTGMSSIAVPESSVLNPVTDDSQPVSDEIAPPAAFFNELRQRR